MESENSEHSEQNTVNSTISKAEARRRRILENSNNRLGKITGRVHNEEIPNVEVAETNGVYPDPEFERDVFEASTSLNPSSNQDVFELLKTLQQDKNITSEPTQQQQQVPQSPFSKFIRSKYPIVILALIAYTLFALRMDKLIGSLVFILLILWEVFEFTMTTFVLDDPVQQNQFTVLIGMFLGLDARAIQILMKILGLFNKILRDIATFLFIFVFAHLFYSYTITGESMSEILDKDFNNLLGKDEL
ncbi:uncharacterized protein [Chironomus tepperi]|uniref:uncharacterized protein n=1 Tax=Chironomus tepperi TaxID=113505 RepID=UPI00391FB379